MSQVKYQVFVSSTYEDLHHERDQVVRAILEMGHIPVGMEMFSAGDEQQWQLIARQIEASDYYVVLVAHRYGSMDGACSYTEKEYDYATTIGVPTLGFVIRDDAPWPNDRYEREPAKQAALAAFKDKVKGKLVSMWTSGDDLHGRVSIALMKQMAATPREGWIRASEGAGPELLSEMTRLSRENRELRAKLDQLAARDEESRRAEHDRILRTLRAARLGISVWYDGDRTWTREEGDRHLYDLFYLLAPQLMPEVSVKRCAALAALVFRKDKSRSLREGWPLPANSIKTWLGDLAALGLVQPSTRRHAVSDPEDYWSLTELGKTIYTDLRRLRLEQGLASESSDDDE